MTDIEQVHRQPEWAREVVVADNPMPFSAVATAPRNFMQPIQHGDDLKRQQMLEMFPFDSETNGPCPNYRVRRCETECDSCTHRYKPEPVPPCCKTCRQVLKPASETLMASSIYHQATLSPKYRQHDVSTTAYRQATATEATTNIKLEAVEEEEEESGYRQWGDDRRGRRPRPSRPIEVYPRRSWWRRRHDDDDWDRDDNGGDSFFFGMSRDTTIIVVGVVLFLVLLAVLLSRR